MPRPRIQISWDQFDKLCAIQCTITEICLWFRCSRDALESAVKREKKSSLKDYVDQMRAQGTVSLRRTMFQTALKGDRQLLIWLSKQHLKMAEKLETKDTTPQEPKVEPTVDELDAEIAKLESLLNAGKKRSRDQAADSGDTPGAVPDPGPQQPT